MLEKTSLFFFTVWAYSTFVFLMFFAFAYHVLVMLFTRGRGVDLLYKCYRPWSYVWGFLNGVKYEIYGRENIKEDQPYVFTCNHGSNGDIFIIAGAMKGKFRPLGKVELTKQPFMGYMFKRALVVVDRSSAESRKKSTEEMKKLISQNISILILPEGTRNRTDKPLKDFYDGAFRIAIETQLPIIPMVIMNTKKLFPNDYPLMKRINLKCFFEKPVSTEGMNESNVQELKERVFNIMWNRLITEDPVFAALKSEAHQKLQDHFHHQSEQSP